jgi:hypothetical protein
MTSLKFGAAIIIALAVASPALADQPKPPAAAKAEGKIEKAGDKAKEGAEKAGDKADKAIEKGKDAGASAKDEAKADLKSDKEATKKKAKEERDELKGKASKALKGKAMHPSLKEELKRHARRLARLDRVEAIAKDAKDDDSLARVKKLVEKENARHDKWMSNFDPTKGGGK